MKVNLNDIKGYVKLPTEWQAMFEATYNRHYEIMGGEMKESLTLVDVSIIKDNGRNVLKAVYNTGDWWHYDRGDWY